MGENGNVWKGRGDGRVRYYCLMLLVVVARYKKKK